MALFGKNGASASGIKESLSIIGEGVELEGALKAPGNLRIEGTFRGRLAVGQRLVIAESGQVTGEVSAGEALIAGEFEGQLACEKHVELTQTARMKGQIRSRSLEIHTGAILNIRCEVSPQTDQLSRSSNEPTAPTNASQPKPAKKADVR